MSNQFKIFDREKHNLTKKLRDIANKTYNISVYDINGIEDLIITFFKLYSFMLLNKNLNIWLYIERLFSKIKIELFLAKITMKREKWW